MSFIVKISLQYKEIHCYPSRCSFLRNLALVYFNNILLKPCCDTRLHLAFFAFLKYSQTCFVHRHPLDLKFVVVVDSYSLFRVLFVKTQSGTPKSWSLWGGVRYSEMVFSSGLTQIYVLL